ncbi:MFS transporter [Kocuria gwangalliensis]|uniref:MFS transporter n=1 Tax=Kocuria gwangalliensis TaxID=501592 RepID=A0ABP8WL52_9MICC
MNSPVSPGRAQHVPTWALGAVGFVSFFDRFGTPPMLLIMSSDTGLDVHQVVQLFTVYSLLYALGQPLWGLLSDRWGRHIVLRIALIGVVVGSIASVLAGGYAALLMARGFTGLTVGALYPTLLTLIGDTRIGPAKVHALSDLLAYSSIGNAVATLTTGAIAAWLSWRVVFAIVGVACVVLLILLRHVHAPKPARTSATRGGAFATWPLTVYGIAFAEGVVLVGILTYVVPALQSVGVSVALAGVLGATYGLGVVAGAPIMRVLSRRFTRTQCMIRGGVFMVVGLGASALSATPIPLTVTAVCIGLANAILHSSVQGWATEVAPESRATTVSFFVTSLFLGAAAGTFVTAGLADAAHFSTIFGIGAVAGLGITVVASAAHARWMRSTATS